MEQAARDAHLWRPVKVEPASQIASTSAVPPLSIKQEPTASVNAFASFDFTALPAALVTDLIVANLQAIPLESLQAAIQVWKTNVCSFATIG